MSEPDTRQSLPLPVVVQPDPLLEDRAGPFRTLIAMAGGALVVVMVLYGLSRPPEPQVAVAPEAGQTTGQNAGQPAPAQNGQQPSTTGSGNQQGAKQTPAQPGSAQPNPGQSAPQNGEATTGEKRSDSATTGKATAAPSDKSQPKQ
jgi:hypothetical protein